MEVFSKLCPICGKITCHPRCPNYTHPKVYRYCKNCKEGIYDGEEYIENEDGECVHLECLFSIRDTLQFLKYKINTENIEYENDKLLKTNYSWDTSTGD